MECPSQDTTKELKMEQIENINMDYAFILTDYPSGFLGSFLSKGLKTNQLEVNTDEKTLRSIARLKEPRDLFALPKDKDNDCPQQAPRWPIECQVIDERITHIQSVPAQPEPYNQPTGKELKPRPVGEENGVVVFNYNPISAVNYENRQKNDSSDSDSSTDSSPEVSTPDRRKIHMKTKFVKMLNMIQRTLSSNSEEEIFHTSNELDGGNDEDVDDDDDDNDTVTNTNTNTSINESGHEKDNVLKNDSNSTWNPPMNFKSDQGQPKPILYTPVRTNFTTITHERLEGGTNHTLSRKHSSSSEGSSSSGSSDNEMDSKTLTWSESGSMVAKRTQTGSIDMQSKGKYHIKTKTELLIETQAELRKLRALAMSFRNPNQGDNRRKKANQNQNHNQNQNQNHNQNQNQNELYSQDSQNSQDDENNEEEYKKISSRLSELSGELKFVEKSLSIPLSSSPSSLLLNSNTSTMPQFSRSAVGGAKFLTNCHPPIENYEGLEFESRFESGNLAKAVMITPTYYELYLRPDFYTSRSKQWFYFRIRKTKKNVVYRFSIVNLVKSDSLYNEGMRPVMYSTINAKERNEGWRRCGQNVVYYRNDEETGIDDEDDNASYSLTWNIEFPHNNDTVFLAHNYPYTYSDLQDYLMEIQKHPVKSKFCKLRLLCRSLAGNNVYYLTVTAPTTDEDVNKRKKAIVVSARVHPSETPASWMMKGLMDFITGDTMVAKKLRHRFIFKLIPMLNPDGVIVGNTRNSLTGKDLNRQYRTVIRETYPSIWYTKAMIKRLIDECGVAMYCDMHAHSRKHNIFIYGCENRRNAEKKLTEQVFPLMMHKNVADKFSFEDCKFKVQRSKEGTGRIVVWMLGITNSYTIEASFGGSTLGSRRGTHFSTGDYEHIGRVFCETLLDYCDENPNKERLRLKIIERLLKEGSSADEPLNIPLSDYSSDEGDTSSSDNEGKLSFTHSDLEGPCCAPLRAPPCSPDVKAEIRKFYQKRMRKIMQELDRIYFQPLFKKKFRALMKSKRSKPKPTKSIERSKKNVNTLSKLSTKTQEPDIISQVENSECDKSPSEKRCEFQHSILNTAEGTRIIAGGYGSRNMKTPGYKKRKPIEEDGESGAFVVDKPPPRKLRVSRRLRLWLEQRNIIIFRKSKKNKNKIRHRIWSTKNKAVRLPFDMPTTDPGSDLIFSTDDEYYTESSDVHLIQTDRNEVVRARRLLQSELQRKYIEEFGGDFVYKKQMPPELVITSPTKQTITTKPMKLSYPFPVKSLQSPVRRAAPSAQLLTEFPIIGAPTAKRTSSWHSLQSTNKTNVKAKMNNPYMPMGENIDNDELQFRLSLKKKIWSGVQPDTVNANQELIRNRPLSWGMPPVTTQVKREKVSTLNVYTKKDDNEELFTACSQKLIAWQQQSSNTNVTASLNSNKAKGKFVSNLSTSDSFDDAFALGICKHTNINKISQKLSHASDLVINDSKAKKRKNPMTKITETSQLITRTSKLKTNSLHNSVHGAVNPRRLKSSQSSATDLQFNGKVSSQTNKFKTGGLVATATAQSKKTRKYRSLPLESKPPTQSAATGAAADTISVTRHRKTTPSTKERTLGVITIDMHAPEDDNQEIRKIKTKLRRKSKSRSNVAIGAGVNINVGVGVGYGKSTAPTAALVSNLKRTQ